MFALVVLVLFWLYWSYKSLKDLWKAYRVYKGFKGKCNFPKHLLKDSTENWLWTNGFLILFLLAIDLFTFILRLIFN